MNRYELGAGRVILRDGVEIARLERRLGPPDIEGGWQNRLSPSEADDFARLVVEALNALAAVGGKQ